MAQVDPALCVSCGICAGSCAPMGVGPAHRTGRFQLDEAKEFIAAERLGDRDIVVIACGHGIGELPATKFSGGAPVFGVDCIGSMHTSVVEYMVRSGVGGVLILSCPPRDCWSREGPTWLNERLYHDREAELKPRVDRQRVRVVYTGRGDRPVAVRELERFRQDVQALDAVTGEDEIDIDEMCRETAEEVEA